MMLLINKELPHMPLKELENDSESVWVKIFANGTSHYIASWHREPSGSCEDFQFIRNQLDYIKSQSRSKKLPSVHVLGDFNFREIVWPERLNKNKTMLSQSDGQVSIDIMNDHGLEQLIHFPTREENTLYLIITSIPGLTYGEAQTGALQQTFKAAVYEHAVVTPTDPETIVSRDEALAHMMKNLETYQIQAEIAGNMGVDVIVFPEYGIYGLVLTRDAIEPYLEEIPDPQVEQWCPCMEPDRFPQTDVQHYLSCLARNNSLYLIANFGDIQPCNASIDPRCPPDGRFQYNTNIAYDKNGTLVARYHKETLYGESQFNKPNSTEYVYFDTPFGRFGVFICFDILFRDPAITLILDYNITHVLFPTAWIDALPFLAAIQFHSAFAVGAGVNLLASNIHIPSMRVHGSGIYTPLGALQFYYNDQTNDGKLLIADVPVLESNNLRNQRKSLRRFPQADDNQEEFNWTIRRDVYTLKNLPGSNGQLTVCQNTLCCHLVYSGKNSTERFALGVLDNLHLSQGDRNYYLQICAMIKCESSSPDTCVPPTKYSSTAFSKIQINGNFSTKFVFPETLIPDGDGLALLQIGDWKFYKNSLKIRNVKKSIISASLLGRIYEKDTLNTV